MFFAKNQDFVEIGLMYSVADKQLIPATSAYTRGIFIYCIAYPAPVGEKKKKVIKNSL